MNKKLMFTLLVAFLASSIAQAAVVVGVLGGSAAVGLGVGIGYHHHKKHHHPDEYCQRHPNRHFCVEREA
jgi:hypothetical protein